MGLTGFVWPWATEAISSRGDFSSETYYCTECGGRLKIESLEDLRPCPRCGGRTWEASEQTRQTFRPSGVG